MSNLELGEPFHLCEGRAVPGMDKEVSPYSLQTSGSTGNSPDWQQSGFQQDFLGHRRRMKSDNHARWFFPGYKLLIPIKR
jgi:hypothetical protein